MAMRSVRVDGAPGGRGETLQFKSWLDHLEMSRGVAGIASHLHDQKDPKGMQFVYNWRSSVVSFVVVLSSALSSR